MKKVIAWLLVLALTAAVSIGATLAYLTDTDEDVNVMTLGKVKIDQLEYERVDVESKDNDATVQEFHDNKPLYPGVYETGFDFGTGDANVDWEQIGKDGYTSGIWNPEKINNELDKMVFVKNKGTYDAYVRTIFAFEAGKYTTLDEFKSMMHLNLNETDFTWTWIETPVTIGGGTYFLATATYNDALEPGALTEISLSQIALDKTATNADVEAFGETYQILVKTQAIQADGFENAATALDEGFGMILADDHPFESDNPVKGSNINNAIHYLNADPSNTKITDYVTAVVFGKNKDYPQIVNNHKGYLVDEEQDVDTYAYYVSNNAKAAGNTYTVYILNDDVIYAPKSCRLLFNKMSNLERIDTTNLDTSRVETMYAMFQKCVKLKSLDVSKWDVSNVKDLTGTFINCNVLEELKGIENWDVSSVTTMLRLFENCYVLDCWDLNGWDTSNVTDMKGIFKNCWEITTIDLSNWDTSKATTMHDLFVGCKNLVEVKGMENWDVSKVTLMISMFYDCSSLKSVGDLSNWDTSSLTDNGYMFINCSALESVDVSNWDTSKITSMMYLFYNCTSLTELDVSGWDVGNVKSLKYLFNGCSGLTSLDVSNWDTHSATEMQGMFCGCSGLKTLDVSGWDTSNVTNMSLMFYADYNLEYVDVSGWDVSKVTAMNHMFSSDHQNASDMALQNVDVSNWNPVSVTNMGSMFYGCGQLTQIDMSGWNLPKLTTVSHMFADCSKLAVVDVSGWQTPSLTCIDAMFNHCISLKTIDMSSFDTSNIREFSQVFEHCYALESVKGLENFNTQSGHDFSEMFSNCYSLKELDLSAFDTTRADPKYLNQGAYTNWVFLRFMENCTGLEKITFGPNFSFDGKGNCPNGYKFVMPSASKVAGWDGKWYTADGTGYLPSEIPEMTAATYYAVNPVKTETPPVDSTNP